MLNSRNLFGNWGSVLLPVNPDQTIDFTRLREEIDYLVTAGLDGIYSNGTAAEMHNQVEEEFDEIQFLLAEKCRKTNVPFQIGASHPVPVVTLDRIKRLRRLNPGAFQVIFPDWIPLNAEEQVSYLQRLAAVAGGIPLVLYNPPHSKKVLSPAELQWLAQKVPELIGIKVGSGDNSWFEEMRTISTQIAVFIPGHFLASGVHQNVAAGAYSNVACLSPKGAQKWWQLMQEDLTEALLIEARILGFFREVIAPFQKEGYSNPALDKFLVAIGNWCPLGTRLRWPYRWIGESEIEPARKKAKEMLPAFLLET